MARILALSGDPERDDWPSVEDKDSDQFCAFCEAMPNETHHPRCPLHGPEIEADEINFCDRCGHSYVSCCGCDDEGGR